MFEKRLSFQKPANVNASGRSPKRLSAPVMRHTIQRDIRDLLFNRIRDSLKNYRDSAACGVIRMDL